MPFSYTNKTVPNFTSKHNKKLWPTFMLYAMFQKEHHKSTGAKVARKMMIKLTPDNLFLLQRIAIKMCLD